jgi:hypothetical protein
MHSVVDDVDVGVVDGFIDPNAADDDDDDDAWL